MSYQSVLEEIHDEVRLLLGQGQVADYIPMLAAVAPNRFGMAVQTVGGELYHVGDALEPFSIQSISKVPALALAMRCVGDALWRRVGREPSGNPFNSLVQLEHENGIPRNPFINAGALVVTDVVLSNTAGANAVLLDRARRLANNPSIEYDEAVARSELEHGHRNEAMAWFLKSFGNLDNPVHEVLESYCRQCSLAMSCVDLARAFLVLANRGWVPWSDDEFLTERQVKRINALMLTCGTYDAVGDFAFYVGLPGKSGVGGGIVAVIPDRLSLCVWSPGLDENGNSLAGVRALELFTTKTGTSIF